MAAEGIFETPDIEVEDGHRHCWSARRRWQLKASLRPRTSSAQVVKDVNAKTFVPFIFRTLVPPGEHVEDQPVPVAACSWGKHLPSSCGLAEGVEPGCEDAILLQTQHKAKQEPPTNCELPEGGKWTLVQNPVQSPYYMAVYEHSDIVSDSLISSRNWESASPEVYGPSGHAYDIGANMGFYTFLLAKAGWNVTAFEPMKSNLRLLKASLCANPDVQGHIDLHEVGLGDSPTHCKLMSWRQNVGDGIVNCGGARNEAGTDIEESSEYEVRDEFDVKLLDEEMESSKFAQQKEMESSKFAQQKVAFVKIDVEGFECHVFRGGKKLLAQHPRLIQTEMWGKMQDCDPRDYMKMFTDANYKVAGEVQCRSDSDDVPLPGSLTNKWFCSNKEEAQLNSDFASVVEFHKNFDAEFHGHYSRIASRTTIFMEPIS
eukprot:s4900_g2.t1